MRRQSQGATARRDAAEKRRVLREARTTVEQAAVLDARLGSGRGAGKERARLAAQS